jgi:hypothetical protein
MKVLLLQLDGKIPNIALMRLAAHHKQRGDTVKFQYCGNEVLAERQLWDDLQDVIYASLIFERSRPIAERLKRNFPKAIIGGTGWNLKSNLEDHGIKTLQQDYTIYPNFTQSIGFTQRGCRLACKFCVVPEKEGRIRAENTPCGIWRGDPWPKELLLLDNDFFGQQDWQSHILEIQKMQFKVSFNQGINARFLTDETAAAIGSIDYRDDSMKVKRIYTAWDNRKDEKRLFDGLKLLCKYGVKPDHIMVYILIGYWPNETHLDRDYRRAALREFGARPYPMPYVRTPELVGFQRLVIGAYDKRISWNDFEAAKYQPSNLKGA